MSGSSKPWLHGIQGQSAHDLIESNAQVIRVVSGPGSGKTTCLKRRTRRLVEGDGVDPKTIFVGTFTRAIARELKEALGEEVKVSTLHSFALEMLRQNKFACQGMGLRFLLKTEQDALLYDIEDEAAEVGDIYARREEIRRLQASRSRRTEFDNAKFAGAVRRWLQRHHAMLIGEVVYLCVVGLERGDIPPGIFDHVVIDEYQDLTAAEQELVRFVWSGGGSLTVLGDDDQSIYGFRFNHPNGVSDFHLNWSDFDCKDITFLENRRSGSKILDTANLMLAEMGSAKPPMLARSGRSAWVSSIFWNTLDDEIKGLARFVRARSDESFLILVPRRFVGYRLAERIGDDAKTSFTEQVLDHQIAQEAFAAASLLANPDDWVSTRAWLGFHGEHRQQAQRRNAAAHRSLPVDTGGRHLIRKIADGSAVPVGPGKTHIRRRAQLAIDLFQLELEPREAIELLFAESLAKKECDPEKRRWLEGNLRELRDAAHELLDGQVDPNLRSVIDAIRYRIATRAPLQTSDHEEPRVKVMTLHSAKGLEADNVVIAGVADQFMPGESTGSEDRAEQQRLLYVAVTRARDSLIVSWPRRIRFDDAKKNMGRTTDGVFTIDGVRWIRATSSCLLPQGLSGIVCGDQWLSESLNR